MRVGSMGKQQWVLLLVQLVALQHRSMAINVDSGQAFVNKTLQWASQGGQLTLQLQTDITLANLTFGTAPSLPSSGRLTVLGVPPATLGSQAPVVLDLAMKSDLTPAFDNPDALLVLENLVVVNLCSAVLSWKPERNWYITISSNNIIMPRSRVHQTTTRTNVTMYVPYGEVLAMMYWQVMYHVPFDDLHAFALTKLLDRVPPVHSLIARVTPYSLLLSTCSLPGGLDTWFEYRATNNPSDPLRLQALGGRLMPHRFCNGPTGTGPVMTAEQQAMNATIFPIWVPPDDASLQVAVGQVASYSLTRTDQDPPPVILVVANLTMPPTTSTLRMDVVFQGPFNQVPGFEASATLNLGNTSLDIAASHIYVANLTLTGLATKLLPGTTYVSALPVHAVVRYSNDNLPVRLYNVTLVVPQADYAALLAAALRGAAWKLGAVQTAPLFSGISTFVPNPSTDASNRSMLLLDSYQGWGVQATSLHVVPATPLAADVVLPDPYTPPPSPAASAQSGSAGQSGSSSEGLSSGAKVGIGVAVGCGFLALGLAAAAWFKWGRAHTAKVPDPELTTDKQLPSKGVGMGGHASSSGGIAPGHSPLPARDLIHRAVSQAQEAIASSTTRTSSFPGMGPKGGLSPQALSLTVSATGATGVTIASGVPAMHAPSGTSMDDSSSGQGGPTNPALIATGSGGTLAGQSSGTPTASGVTALAAGDASLRPGVVALAGSGKLSPHEAVMAKAGTLQKSDADKLTLTSVLGRGAWGTVYKGTWRGLMVAVKTVLFSEREDGDTTLPHERAIMEAAVCTSVAHRNVVATYHYDIKPVRMVVGQDEGLVVETPDNDAAALGFTDWKLFLVQEWCNSTLGQALRSWLLHKKPSREPLMDLLLDLLLDVAAGIQYLHDKNIIHGDLKPENVMLKTDGSAQIGVVAKITDFGLSTTLGPQATHVSNYKSGTPFYVAPEVTMQGRTTKASDTYSFGVLMWETYCCMPPWIKVGGEYQANSRFPTFPADTPRPFARLARSCLARDIKQRPPFSEIMASLQAMLDAWQAGYDNLQKPSHHGPAAAPLMGGPAGKPVPEAHSANGATAPAATATVATAGAAEAQERAVPAGACALQRHASGAAACEGGADGAVGQAAAAGLGSGLKPAGSAALSEWVRTSQPNALPAAPGTNGSPTSPHGVHAEGW